MAAHEKELVAFTAEKGFRRSGEISIALIVTQHGKKTGLPLDPDKLLTQKGGAVQGAGGDAVLAILKRHGITRRLSKMGGRTSRGSVDTMRVYVAFLNELARAGKVDLEAVESFWIGRVREFFAAKPFKIKLDAAKGLRAVVRDVIAQAEERQKNAPGLYYAGALLQHLVGAKLDCALGKGLLQHNSFSTADEPGARAGDFFLGNVAIHVTTSPGEALIERCRENLNEGHRPVLVTLQRGLTVAEGLASNVSLADRIDVFEIEQFVALNLYELGEFALQSRQTVVRDFVKRYNEIVEEYETDPSLKIELRQ